jgi:hypothetical protein
MAQVLAGLHVLGWGPFIVLWTSAIFFAVWYCARSWTLVLLVPGFLVVRGLLPSPAHMFLAYALLGNVQWFIAAGIVAALREHPGFWAVSFLTKVGPGVGFVYHIGAREWRKAVIAVGLTAAICAVSFALAPQLWVDYLRLLAGNPSMEGSELGIVPIPLLLRLAGAAIVCAIAGWARRPWLVPLAAGVAIPALYLWTWLPIWAGAIALARPPRLRFAGLRRLDQPESVS